MTDPGKTPYELLGGEAVVRSLVEHFYDAMGRDEPALAKLHRCDEQNQVCRQSRDRFALFFIGWLGGKDDYVQQYGHPRLRMRHARVPVDASMRDAWLRAMTTAMDEVAVSGWVRGFLAQRLAEVADFLRNT